MERNWYYTTDIRGSCNEAAFIEDLGDEREYGGVAAVVAYQVTHKQGLARFSLLTKHNFHVRKKYFQNN